MSYAFVSPRLQQHTQQQLEPVLTLKQAFQVLLRLPITPRLLLHRNAIAHTMLQFFADIEPSVAQVRASPSCTSLLLTTSNYNNNHNNDDNMIMMQQLRTRLADAETALLTFINHTADNHNNNTTGRKSKKQRVRI